MSYSGYGVLHDLKKDSEEQSLIDVQATVLLPDKELNKPEDYYYFFAKTARNDNLKVKFESKIFLKLSVNDKIIMKGFYLKSVDTPFPMIFFAKGYYQKLISKKDRNKLINKRLKLAK